MLFSTILRSIYFSFPCQLVILLFKKNHILLFYWLLLLGFITQTIGVKWGIPYLFLDPEYMGSVGFWSFFILGISFGGFIMTFNISSYILNGFRFPFLATLSKPFEKFMINNSVVPIFFSILLMAKVFWFQYYFEYHTIWAIAVDLMGFMAGGFLIIALISTYFFSTNKDIFRMFNVKENIGELPLNKNEFYALSNRKYGRVGKEWHVETYISDRLKLRLVRGTQHYPSEMIFSVFKQNHLNAAIVEVATFILVIVLGLFRDLSFFRIPAGASLFLMFSLFIMLSSALRFWLRGWSSIVFILILLVMNFFSQFDVFSSVSQAYGLNYTIKPASYSSQAIKELNSDKIFQEDYNNTLQILETWKKNLALPAGKKPQMVFVNTSGGGLRSALWTLRTLQLTDSMLKGQLFKHTKLISGSSGGMMGAAYYRELYLRSLQDNRIQKYQKKYFNNIGKDLLNTVALSVTVNDLFLNIQEFSDGNYNYSKDRAYAFEKQFDENTGHFLNKRLGDYYEPEKQAKIPLLVMCPTIANDGRRLYISPQPISYLTEKRYSPIFQFQPIHECVEFTRMFAQQNAKNLRFISALRMNATFPYILPNVTLPSSPQIEVMDAGVRDNFGNTLTLQFLFVFRDWIEKNTSGVIVVQIRDTPKDFSIEKNIKNTTFQNISTPIGSIYSNLARSQDYNHDALYEYASAWYKGPLSFVSFELPNSVEKISLSWHLTSREKNYIFNAISLPENQKSINKLKVLLGENKALSN